MKIILASLMGALLLAGCKGAPPNEKVLTQSCSTLFEKDAGLVMELVGEDSPITLDSFCSCYGASVAETPEIIDLHKNVLTSLITASEDAGGDIEKAARSVRSAADAGVIDLFTSEQLDEVGEYFEDVGNSMAPTGQCPAPK